MDSIKIHGNLPLFRFYPAEAHLASVENGKRLSVTAALAPDPNSTGSRIPAADLVPTRQNPT